MVHIGNISVTFVVDSDGPAQVPSESPPPEEDSGQESLAEVSRR